MEASQQSKKDELRDRLATIFRSVFQLPPDADPTEVRQISAESWDSLAHVSMITAVESEFEIEIDVSEAMEMTSFEAVALLLEDAVEGCDR